MLSILPTLLFLGVCEAQFGGFGGFGGATQNCAGSQCNQNNFGRRKREIVSKLIEEAHKIAEEEQAEAERQDSEAQELHSQEKRDAQVQNCVGSQCNQNNLVGGFAGFGAGFPSAGGFGAGFGGGATQNCIGSQCNQNNGRRKREIVDAINALAEEALEVEKQEEAEAIDIQKREADAQVQNCQGSSCNQNNLGGGFAGFGAGFPAAAGFGAGFAGGATQNCVGSQCNQNNGRKKREIVDAINALATEVLEAEKQEETEAIEIQKREADAQVQNCQGSSCNQNNLGGGFAGFGAGFPAAAGGFGAGFAGGATQNCVGSQCNQNNGRRKREIIAALLEEVL